ncbi:MULTISPECIES: BA3454 family stress response protein [Bacillus]|uniref:Molecular chaperone n=2 Tax=Bacillus cereus group TaxID=86661 RepID=A0A2A7D3A3_BACAN|nr:MULTISPECIES: BA3454 family stress response protein [Bacillus]MCP1164528.1 BA3454 family stress response protein [Bacillus sp. 1813sda1]MDC7971444.1 BA3454 family stress response protein [Bacillus sp. BLCC-B18]OTW71053.1 molecular chaperone [Bacillus thuringiensis serovar coreanensis]OTX41555.1 molecular chaperone [Bacillus thuringiensis serovar sooncheon]OTX47558.1 molecular chaperone [Bacillus thuringiensis serovar guiyangiensis]
MIEVRVTVNYKDRNYHTNVIVNKDTIWTKIKQLAEEQVKKQWTV